MRARYVALFFLPPPYRCDRPRDRDRGCAHDDGDGRSPHNPRKCLIQGPDQDRTSRRRMPRTEPTRAASHPLGPPAVSEPSFASNAARYPIPVPGPARVPTDVSLTHGADQNATLRRLPYKASQRILRGVEVAPGTTECVSPRWVNEPRKSPSMHTVRATSLIGLFGFPVAHRHRAASPHCARDG